MAVAEPATRKPIRIAVCLRCEEWPVEIDDRTGYCCMCTDELLRPKRIK